MGDLEGWRGTQATRATDIRDGRLRWTGGPGGAFIAFTSLQHDVRLATAQGAAWAHTEADARHAHALLPVDAQEATLDVRTYRAGPDGYFVAMFTPLPDELRAALPPAYAPLG